VFDRCRIEEPPLQVVAGSGTDAQWVACHLRQPVAVAPAEAVAS